MQLEVRLGNFSLFTVKGKTRSPIHYGRNKHVHGCRGGFKHFVQMVFPEQHGGLLHEFFDVVGLEGAQCIGSIEGKAATFVWAEQFADVLDLLMHQCH